MRRIEVGMLCTVGWLPPHLDGAPEVPAGSIVEVLRARGAGSCDSCGGEQTTDWITTAPDGGEMIACACFLIPIDPDQDQSVEDEVVGEPTGRGNHE